MTTLLLATLLMFPAIQGDNLAGRAVDFPAEFAKARATIVIVAFQREQQPLVNTWNAQVQELLRQQADLRYFELPTLASGYRLMRPMINGGMRSGIKDPVARERTVTLYLKKQPFKDALEIGSEDTIHTLLVDAAGCVRWRTEGEMSAVKGTQLRQAVEALLQRE